MSVPGTATAGRRQEGETAVSMTEAGPFDPATYASQPPSEDFGRTPPQDVAAEQSVLGGMMLSKDAIADVIEQVRGTDFYRPAHELVFEAILDLYGRGEPADAVTVAAELTKRGELGRVGGAAYLHTLISSVPTAANAGYYGEIVRERAVLRRLVDAGTKIVQLGYASGGGDVDDLVNQAQAEVYSVTERRTSEDYVPLSETIEGTINEIEISEGRGDEMIGVPTGFSDLDQLTNGLHPGQMIVLAARPAMGKALALDTPLATPTGWTTMGEVQVGDELIAADGTPTRVVAATEVLQDRPCYEVVFDDGSTIVADAWHEWLTDDRRSRRGTRGASAPSCAPPSRSPPPSAAAPQTAGSTTRVRNARPLQLPEAELPVDPYVLGAWLGDGSTDAPRIHTADDEMVMRLEGLGLRLVPAGPFGWTMRLPEEPAVAERACVVCGTVFVPATSQVKTCGRSCGGRASAVSPRSAAPTCPDCGGPSSGLRRCSACHADHGSMTALLRKVGVLGNKHIPATYLRGSEAQRRALLAGLLDTDGTVNRTGSVQFAVHARAPGRRLLRAALLARLPLRPLGQARRGPHGGVVDVLDGHLHHHRRGVRPHPQAARAQGAAAHAEAHGPPVRRRGPADPVGARAVRDDRPPRPPVRRRPDDGSDPQLHGRSRHRAELFHQARQDVGDLLARDEPQRDHHAPAVGRGVGQPPAHAQGHDARGGLDQARADDGPGQRGAAVHRRQPEHVADGDPRQVPPAQAAARPQARRHRLPAADELGQARRVAPAGGLGVLPRAEAAGQGARGAGDRGLAS